MIHFQGAKITLSTGFLLLRAMDGRFGILGPIESELADARSWIHSNHTQVQMVRQRVYQIAAGSVDCDDANFRRIDPALRLAIGKGDDAAVGQSRLSRLENEVLGTEAGLKALENALTRPERESRITFGGGISMWLQPSPWLDTTALCSDDERGGKNG